MTDSKGTALSGRNPLFRTVSSLLLGSDHLAF